MNPAEDPIRAAAAAWVIRRDRGLSASEAVDFELWLAADPRHRAAMERAAGAWSMLDRIPENVAAPVLAAATRRRSFWRRTAFGVGLAAAAAVVGGVVVWRARDAQPAQASVQVAAAPRQLTLPDGSVLALNAGAEYSAHFTATERRITLHRGEAHFDVAHEKRPFVVRAGHVDVRAVGTAFDVHLESAAVEVLVTNGVVKLNPSADGTARPGPDANSIPSLSRGQRAIVALAPTVPQVAVVVTSVTPEEIARTLAWQEPLLRLGGATLAEVAANFARRTGRQVRIEEPELGKLRLGGRFRADDAEGFASVIASTLEIEVEHAPDGTLVLRKKTSTGR